MLIKEMPFYNRPHYKLIEKGPEYLDEAELIAIIINSGNKKENAIDLSNRLLKKHNLHGLGRLSYNELKKEFNGDKIKPTKIISLIELSKRYSKLINNGFTKKIDSAKDVFNIYSHKFLNEKKENFVVLCLDSKNKIIKEEPVSIGILDSSLVHPREVFKGAIKESAYSIILIHNHPSGDSTPSKQDLEVTKILMRAGETLGIPVVDHIIVGRDSYFSFKEKAEQI